MKARGFSEQFFKSRPWLNEDLTKKPDEEIRGMIPLCQTTWRLYLDETEERPQGEILLEPEEFDHVSEAMTYQDVFVVSKKASPKMQEMYEKGLTMLATRPRFVIEEIYENNKSPEEIAKILKITKRQVNRIREKAEEILRSFFMEYSVQRDLKV